MNMSYSFYKESSSTERLKRLNRKPYAHKEREYKRAKRAVLEVKEEIQRFALRDEELRRIAEAEAIAQINDEAKKLAEKNT